MDVGIYSGSKFQDHEVAKVIQESWQSQVEWILKEILVWQKQTYFPQREQLALSLVFSLVVS